MRCWLSEHFVEVTQLCGCSYNTIMDFEKVLYLAFILFIFDVAPTAGEGQLTCHENGMTIKFNKSELDASGRVYNLMFKGESGYPCEVNSSTTSNIEGEFIWIKADYNECGIHVYENGDKLTYNQTLIVAYGKNPNTVVIFRVEHDEYNIECNKMTNLKASMDMFNVSKDGKTFYKVGESSFEVELLRYRGGSFATLDTSGRANLGDYLYFMLKLKTNTNLSLYPQNCYAIDKTGSSRYTIIKSRCATGADSSYQTMEFRRKYFAWKMKSFRFFGNSDEISISCDALICLDGSTNPGCSSCQSRNRKRRGLPSLQNFETSRVDETRRLSIRTGWILLVDENELEEKNSPPSEPNIFSGTTGLVIILLMAIFVFILGAAIIKKIFFTSTATNHPAVPLKISESGFDDQTFA